MSSKVAVVIPTYKEELNPLEKISLDRCRKILGKYPLIFVAPDGKKFSYFAPNDGIAYFQPQFFQNVQTYSRLLMSHKFYAAFKDFEYILIYQLDAFVFYDALENFCQLGYDYIGAPWPMMYSKRIDGNLLRIGNGGFSLRNVKSHHKLLTVHADLIHQCLRKNFPEDLFFSYCGARDDCDFHVAPVDVAYKFSAEFNPARVYKKNSGKLPFGCHAWCRQNPEFYVKIFPQLGYDLSPFQNILRYSDGGLKNWLINFAMQRLTRRLQRWQAILRYLPTKNFTSVIVIRHPFNMLILARLLTEDSSLADKIFLYNSDELDILLHDLTPQKLPHLLIDSEITENLTESLEKKGFAYGKRIVSFQREYLNRCEKLFHNLGKTAL